MAEVDLLKLFEYFELDDCHVLHVFLVGSRLWGTNSHSSDYDFLIVTDNLYPQILKSRHKNRYDITILSQAEFVARLTAGSLVETLCCLLASDELCHPSGQQSIQHLVSNITVVDEWVSSRHLVDLKKAQKYWQKGKQKDAFKILQHMIAAESIVGGLKSKVEGTAGQLSSVSLALVELQALVRNGRDEGDWTWFGLDWEAVQARHSDRLQQSR